MPRLVWHATWILAIGLLVGCATGTKHRISDAEFARMIEEYNDGLPPEEQIHCEKILETGSHIPKWTCRGRLARDMEEMRKDDILRLIRSRPGTRTGN